MKGGHTMSSMPRIAINQVEHIRVWGRTVNSPTSAMKQSCQTKDDKSVDSPLALFWTGSGIELSVQSSELWVEVEADYEVYEPWLSVLINGAVVSRQMLMKGKQFICLFRNLNRDTPKVPSDRSRN